MKVVVLVDREGKIMVAFLKNNTFSHLGTPHAIIKDEGSYFCNKVFQDALAKYSVK